MCAVPEHSVIGAISLRFGDLGDLARRRHSNRRMVNDGGQSNSGSWADYDNDGNLDLFVTNVNENNFLYRNNGNGTFTKIGEGAIVTDGGGSIGAAWGDYDK